MSKKTKTRASQESRRRKAAVKAANAAKYQSWRDAGTNSKSKRSTLRARRSRMSMTKHMHLIANCGNPGCASCFPRQ